LKVCKSCGIFIESGEYCFECGLKALAEIARNAGITVDEATAAILFLSKKVLKNNKKKDNKLGNPKQDKEILKFLREKRKRENKKYLNKNSSI